MRHDESRRQLLASTTDTATRASGLAELDGQLTINEVDLQAFAAAASPVFDYYEARFGTGWIETARELEN